MNLTTHRLEEEGPFPLCQHGHCPRPHTNHATHAHVHTVRSHTPPLLSIPTPPMDYVDLCRVVAVPLLSRSRATCCHGPHYAATPWHPLPPTGATATPIRFVSLNPVYTWHRASTSPQCPCCSRNWCAHCSPASRIQRGCGHLCFSCLVCDVVVHGVPAVYVVHAALPTLAICVMSGTHPHHMHPICRIAQHGHPPRACHGSWYMCHLCSLHDRYCCTRWLLP